MALVAVYMVHLGADNHVEAGLEKASDQQREDPWGGHRTLRLLGSDQRGLLGFKNQRVKVVEMYRMSRAASCERSFIVYWNKEARG